MSSPNLTGTRMAMVEVDKSLWQEFKTTATYHGFTLKGAIAHALRQWIERNAIPSSPQR